MLRSLRTPRADRRSPIPARITRPWVAAFVVAASAASVLTAVQPTQAATPRAAEAAAALPAGWSTVVNAGSGKCLDARSAATVNGTAVQQYACNNSTAQQWSFTPRATASCGSTTATTPLRSWM